MRTVCDCARSTHAMRAGQPLTHLAGQRQRPAGLGTTESHIDELGLAHLHRQGHVVELGAQDAPLAEDPRREDRSGVTESAQEPLEQPVEFTTDPAAPLHHDLPIELSPVQAGAHSTQDVQVLERHRGHMGEYDAVQRSQRRRERAGAADAGEVGIDEGGG